MFRSFVVSAATLICMIDVVTAQTAAFDVATIRPSPAGAVDGGWRVEPDGSTTIMNYTLKNLVMGAWLLQDFQVVGGPNWVTSDRFDVQAKKDTAYTREDSRLMLRDLLGQRFHLAYHFENRELPRYALVPARGGSKLKPSVEGACKPAEQIPPPKAEPGQPPYCTLGQRLLRQPEGPPLIQFYGHGTPVASLARAVGTMLDRAVVDETGIEGSFEIDLRYVDRDLLERTGNKNAAVQTEGPSIFAALEEQLGLKLESQKGDVQVLVIDQVERPTEN